MTSVLKKKKATKTCAKYLKHSSLRKSILLYNSIKDRMHMADKCNVQLLRFSPGLINMWQQWGRCTVHIVAKFDTGLLFFFVSPQYTSSVHRRQVWRCLSGNQLSLFMTLGCKTLRMRSLFVRSEGSSLFCKTQEIKMNRLRWSCLVCVFSSRSTGAWPCSVKWGLHWHRAAAEQFECSLPWQQHEGQWSRSGNDK